MVSSPTAPVGPALAPGVSLNGHSLERTDASPVRLSATQAAIARRLDGTTSVEGLRRVSSTADSTLAWLHELGAIVPPPLRALPPASAHRLLVLEPHADDAALSVGGSLLLTPSSTAVTIASIMKQSSYTELSEKFTSAALLAE